MKQKAGFTTELIVRQIDEEKRTWALEAPLEYFSPFIDELIIAPTGFITDFASVPRVPIAYTFY